MSQASECIDRALELDPDHERAKALKAETKQRQEANFMAQAKQNMERAEDLARKDKERSLGSYNAAAENFRHAQELNPENKAAEQGLQEAEKGLAEAYKAAGEKELAKAEKLMAKAEQKKEVQQEDQAKAASEKKPKAPGTKVAQEKAAQASKPPSPQDINDLQQLIGHLEKAAQNFAQAEAINPGATESAQQESLATEQLNDVRNELDQALAQAQQAAQQAQESENPSQSSPQSSQASNESKPPKSGEPAAEPQLTEGKAKDGWDAVHILSFSQIRGSGKGNTEGAFNDNSDDSFVRDW